jgi:uncharacterized membrane protein YebE (DUF533 family)
MDIKSVLDQLLISGKQVASQAGATAEKGLGVPATGPQRDAMLSGLGKGALAGGLLALLLGTRRGRRLTGGAIKFGSLAAIAAVAYRAYQSWQSQSNQAPSAGRSISDLSGEAANRRATVLLRAMIASANADGHIDATERANIQQQLNALGLSGDLRALIEREIQSPLSPDQLAQQIDSAEAAAEVYLLSKVIVDDANPPEQAFLARLTSALKLAPDLIARLNAEAATA